LLFAREDGVEAAWRVVDGVVHDHPDAIAYQPGTWGPEQASALVASHGGWHDPVLEDGPVDASAATSSAASSAATA